MDREILAAIDIGSNAVRLLINYVETDRSVYFRKAAYVRAPIRLGEDVFTQGYVSDEKREKLSKAMQAFSFLLQTFDVRKCRACATSAMREAKNGQEIIKYILKESGIDIEIISGKEEAETIVGAGNMATFIDPGKSYLYVDVGGGSTEVSVYTNNKCVVSKSFPLGTVRIISGAVDKKENKFFKEWLKDIADTYRPTTVIGSGGNINKVYKLFSKKEKEPLHYNELNKLYDELDNISYEQRMKDFGLNTYRADVIMPAIKIFLTACKVCRIEEIIVPKIGLADGIIAQLYHELSENNVIVKPE